MNNNDVKASELYCVRTKRSQSNNIMGPDGKPGIFDSPMRGSTILRWKAKKKEELAVEVVSTWLEYEEWKEKNPANGADKALEMMKARQAKEKAEREAAEAQAAKDEPKENQKGDTEPENDVPDGPDTSKWKAGQWRSAITEKYPDLDPGKLADIKGRGSLGRLEEIYKTGVMPE